MDISGVFLFSLHEKLKKYISQLNKYVWWSLIAWSLMDIPNREDSVQDSSYLSDSQNNSVYRCLLLFHGFRY